MDEREKKRERRKVVETKRDRRGEEGGKRGWEGKRQRPASTCIYICMHRDLQAHVYIYVCIETCKHMYIYMYA